MSEATAVETEAIEKEKLVQEVTKAVTEKTEANPLDVQAQMFFLYSPRFLNMIKMMNKKALMRLIYSLIQHPLNDKELKTRSKLEQDAFQIGDELLTSKYLMILHTYMENDLKATQEAKNVEEAKKELDKPVEV